MRKWSVSGCLILFALSALGAEERPWHAYLINEHQMPLSEDGLAVTQFYVGGSYQGIFTKDDKIEVRQPAHKLYEVGPGQSEFQADDMAVRYYYPLAKPSHKLEITLRPSFTIPLSTLSQDQGNVTRLGIMIQFSQKVFGDSFILRWWPAFRYHLNNFVSTESGTPNPQFTISNYLEADFRLSDPLHFFVTGLFDYKLMETSQRVSDTDPAEPNYEFDTYLQYQFNPFLSSRIGFNQADDMILDGRYEVNVYDPQKSKLYLALDLVY